MDPRHGAVRHGAVGLRTLETALRALVYLACTQHPDGGFAQNFWVNGTPYWTGIQLDEVAFPIILAWRLGRLDGLGNFDVCPCRARSGFLVRYAPITQQERWEENAGYSPSTLAAVISALICAADSRASRLRQRWASSWKSMPTGSRRGWTEWTTTTDGTLVPAFLTTTCASVRRLQASRSMTARSLPE